MHLSMIIAALAPASLISGYITIHSKKYCGESNRAEVTKWDGKMNSCYNMDGAAAIQFTEVGQPYSWVCNAYTSSNCQGKVVAFSSYTQNSECNNSPIGWLYSYKCYIK